MCKVCYICGHKIKNGEPYFSIGTNSYVCNNPGCYEEYYWDMMAARFVVDKHHEYVVTENGRLFGIGSDLDEPRGFGGRHFTIKFYDGTVRETNSLWFRSIVPPEKRHIFKPNATIEGAII